MRIDYGVFFQKDNLITRIPVNPSELTITLDGNNDTYNVIGIGEIVIPRDRLLRRVSWSSFLPSTQNFVGIVTEGSFRDAEYYINLWNSYLESKEPFRFIMTRYLVDGTLIKDENFQVVIDSLVFREVGAETGDFYYDINLVEWRPYYPTVVQLVERSDITNTDNTVVSASAEEQREIPNSELCVGDNVTVNGTYYYTSYGDGPTGSANNLQTTITRIVDEGIAKTNQKWRYHVGSYGWVDETQLMKV